MFDRTSGPQDFGIVKSDESLIEFTSLERSWRANKPNPRNQTTDEPETRHHGAHPVGRCGCMRVILGTRVMRASHTWVWCPCS
jgi:hypothetical protein